MQEAMWLASHAADPRLKYDYLLKAASIQPEFGAPPEIVLGTIGRAVMLFPARKAAWVAARKYCEERGLPHHLKFQDFQAGRGGAAG